MDNISISNYNISPDLNGLGKAFLIIPLKNETSDLKFKLYRHQNKCDEADPFLTIRVNDTTQGIKINGSIRKWWFGKRSAVQDFDYKSFCLCIGTISKKLNISQLDFWESKVTYLEIGGSIKLKRKYEFIIPSMISFPRLGKAQFKNETVYFKGANYELIAYDKIKEIFKEKSNSKRLRDKICKGVFVMRFEIKLKTPSGTNLKHRVNTLLKIKNNWGFLINYWESTYSKIEFNKIQNPELISAKEHLTRRELKEYCVVLGVDSFGIEFINNIINTNFIKNHRSGERKHVLEICKKFEVKEFSQYKNEVFEAVNKKAQIMKRYSSDV